MTKLQNWTLEILGIMKINDEFLMTND